MFSQVVELRAQLAAKDREIKHLSMNLAGAVNRETLQSGDFRCSRTAPQRFPSEHSARYEAQLKQIKEEHQCLLKQVSEKDHRLSDMEAEAKKFREAATVRDRYIAQMKAEVSSQAKMIKLLKD